MRFGIQLEENGSPTVEEAGSELARERRWLVRWWKLVGVACRGGWRRMLKPNTDLVATRCGVWCDGEGWRGREAHSERWNDAPGRDGYWEEPRGRGGNWVWRSSDCLRRRVQSRRRCRSSWRRGRSKWHDWWVGSVRKWEWRACAKMRVKMSKGKRSARVGFCFLWAGYPRWF